MNEMQSLDFVGVGAEKAGTSWLSAVFDQHPEIFVPQRKELHYFNKHFTEDPTLENPNYSNSWEWYVKFFTDARPEQVKGEFCPPYLWDPQAPHHLKASCPRAKIIIILRNPVERSFSQCMHQKQRGVIPYSMSFEQALEQFPRLVERSLYYEHVAKYYELFPAHQIFLTFFEDMMSAKEQTVQEVERFLGVSEFLPQNLHEKSNATGTPKYPALNRALTRTRLFLLKYNMKPLLSVSRATGLSRRIEHLRNNSKTSEVKPETVSSLQKARITAQYFREDIRTLENFLNSDLSHWYTYD